MDKIYKDGFKMLGEQYFKVQEDNEVDLIRVINVNNKDEVTILDSKAMKLTMNVKDIQDNYELLATDGLITIAVADMGVDKNNYKVEDVVVCLYRKTEMNFGDYVPYVVCRQNITDFFATHFVKYTNNNKENYMAGVSVSRDTCPENIPFDAVRACNGVSDAIAINIYIEDTVDSILAMVKPNKMKVYNRVLEACRADHIKAARGMDSSLFTKQIDGYCSTLRELLESNNFQFDFDSAFNLLKIDVDLESELVLVDHEVFGKHYMLPDYITNQLSKLLRTQIADTIVVPYDHEIALSDLAGTKYIMLRDNANFIYIVNYTSSGEYREVDLEVIAVETEMNKRRNIFNSVNDTKYKH